MWWEGEGMAGIVAAGHPGRAAMSIWSSSAWLGLLAVTSGCDDLRGFAGAEAPLARVEVVVSGEFEAVRSAGTADEPPRLRVALLWGAQWLPEPLCYSPAESAEARAVQLAGCRDSFGFVPALVGGSAPVVEGRASIALRSLPPADVLVGGVTARVAYASVVVFDDRDGDGTLVFGHALLEDSNGLDVTAPAPPDEAPRDIVYGASFPIVFTLAFAGVSILAYLNLPVRVLKL